MELTPAQWDLVKDLFESALGQDPDSRDSFLAKRCPSDEVRRELQRLLAHQAEMGSFISGPAMESLSLPTRGTAGAPTFQADDTLAERFKIVRFIARGGMGEVYEAQDLELRSRVAIKVIRPDLLRPAVLERFKNEVQVAKRVTHPNVCRIYDLFRHRAAGPGAREVYFISMELLQGETLAERLRQSPCMRVSEALGIVRQIADALSAAHAAGVLHRDLKPANIVLLESAESEPQRAVVTDFGLALQSLGGLNTGGEDFFVGTPAYMSPEQLQAKRVTPASDVYSLGLVIYRMVTGVRPFENNIVDLFGLDRLTKKPRPPSEVVPNLDRRLEAVILKCLEAEPSRRYQSGRDVTDALAWEARTGRLFDRIVRYLAVAAAVLAVWLGIGLWSARQVSRPAPGGAIAIIGFENESAGRDALWISKALALFLTAQLAAGSRLSIVPDDEVTRLEADSPELHSKTLSGAVLGRLRSRLNAGLVVHGWYTAYRANLRIFVRIMDTSSGATVVSLDESGPESMDLFFKVGQRLREALRVPPITTHDADEMRASVPSSLDAFRLYAEGLDLLDRFETQQSRERLERSVESDPRFALAHSALAEAWSSLGYDSHASTEAHRAFDLSGNLSWRDRLMVEGRFREMSHELELAADIYRRLSDAYPNEISYTLRLAAVQDSAGKAPDVRATVAKMRRLPPPARDDPRIDLTEAAAAEDPTIERTAASKAANKARARGDRQLLAAARREEGWALIELGKWKEAVDALMEARRLYTDLGDRAHAAYASLNLATALNGHAPPDDRRGLVGDALKDFRSVGDKNGEGGALNNLAGQYEDAGKLQQALSLYKAAGAVLAEIGQRNRLGQVHNNIASVIESQGDLSGAKKEYEASLAIHRALKSRGDIALTLANIASLNYHMGDLRGAAHAWEHVSSIYRDIHHEDGLATAKTGKADIDAAEGRFAIAQRNYADALDRWTKTDNKSGMIEILDRIALADMYLGNLVKADERVGRAMQLCQQSNVADWRASTQLLAARLALEQGKTAEAEVFASQAAQTFRDGHNPTHAAEARLMLARCRLAKGQFAVAQSELDQAAAFVSKSLNQILRMDFLITSSRVSAAAGNKSRSRELIQTALDESGKLGLRVFHLEALLAKGEAELKMGNVSAGTSELATAQGQATAMGLGLIAHKATRALSAAVNRSSAMTPQ